MAARNRPRVFPKGDDSDAHEEKDLWTKLVTELHKQRRNSNRIKEIADEITTLEGKVESGKDDIPSEDAGRIEKLMEERVQLCEEEHTALSKLIEINDLLIALRTATEGGDRGGVSQQKRIKRKHDESVSADSPSSRNTKVQRANSLAPLDALQQGSEVAYRLPKQKGAEGEWIQCIITHVSGEGAKRKFEVEDPEPDDAGGHMKYTAQRHALIPIPRDSAGLPPYPNGKQVLARYPETTTFYRAEVIATKRDGTCRLKFEGEEEVGKETEVERRLVLDVGNK
ncbi:SGF29 tudor-like domain-containing protein [Pyronema omphalodes]|nr:SGF29 tudor-like domain-containing protein [Pyronema omphalodes]